MNLYVAFVTKNQSIGWLFRLLASILQGAVEVDPEPAESLHPPSNARLPVMTEMQPVRGKKSH